MDVFTHALAGFALARAGLNRFTPHAVPIAMLGAVAPDIDVAFRAAGPLAYLEWSRSATHSWLMAPLFAAAAAGLVGLIRPVRWFGALLAGFAGVASHIFLDFVSVGGVAWLWPSSRARYGVDWTITGDPWAAMILSLAVIAPFLSGLVSGEIGAKRTPGRGWAIASIVLVVAYLGVRGQLHSDAIGVLESRVYDGRAPVRTAAIPDAWSLFYFRGLVEDRSATRTVTLNLREQFDPEAAYVFYPPENSAAMETAKRSGLYERIRPVLTWPRWESIPVGEGVEVRVEDLKLGWAATFELDARGRIVDERFDPAD